VSVSSQDFAKMHYQLSCVLYVHIYVDIQVIYSYLSIGIHSYCAPCCLYNCSVGRCLMSLSMYLAPTSCSATFWCPQTWVLIRILWYMYKEHKRSCHWGGDKGEVTKQLTPHVADYASYAVGVNPIRLAKWGVAMSW